MADKDFRVKNRLHVNGLSQTSGVILATNNALDAHTNVPTQYGGTGTTTSPNAGQILYSSAGTNYAPTDLSSLVVIWGNTSVSSNITLAKNNRYFVDTSAARTLTLPASPSLGDEIQVFDASGTAATNNMTINRNGGKINGISDNLLVDVNGAAFSLIYTGSAYGWVVK